MPADIDTYHRNALLLHPIILFTCFMGVIIRPTIEVSLPPPAETSITNEIYLAHFKLSLNISSLECQLIIGLYLVVSVEFALTSLALLISKE